MSRTWRVPESVRWMRVDDELVVFNPAAGTFAELDPTAADLWLVLGSAAWREGQMVEYLRTKYAMNESEATEAVRAFIADLEKNNALTRLPWAGQRADASDALGAQSHSPRDVP